METIDFQRARSPEQLNLRREAILTAAREMLDRHPTADVSLRELSRHVGLSKSNVVRYFPTREAVFLTVLVEDWDAWLSDLAIALPPVGARQPPRAQNQLVAIAIAQTLSHHPRFCDLLATSPSVLEHNVPEETARAFKSAAKINLARLAELVTARVPVLSSDDAFQFAGLTWAFTTGLWPMANPSPTVRTVLSEPDLAGLSVEFVPAITRALSLLLDGLTRRRDSAR